LQERAAHVLGEGKRRVPAAFVVGRRQVVIENTADAARLLAVGQIEILVAPFFEALLVGDRVFFAGAVHRGMEGECIGIRLRPPAHEYRCQIRAASEPPF